MSFWSLEYIFNESLRFQFYWIVAVLLSAASVFVCLAWFGQPCWNVLFHHIFRCKSPRALLIHPNGNGKFNNSVLVENILKYFFVKWFLDHEPLGPITKGIKVQKFLHKLLIFGYFESNISHYGKQSALEYIARFILNQLSTWSGLENSSKFIRNSAFVLGTNKGGENGQIQQ